MFLLSALAPISIGYNVKTLNLSNNGNTLFVGGIGPGNYSKIQHAIENASEGDTVFVYDDSSPYYENVPIRKRINLIGENSNTTIINGVDDLSATVGLSSNSNNVLVSGFTITGGYVGIGISTNNNFIHGNKIILNKYGVELWDDTYNNEITNNIIIHNSRAGIIDECHDSTNIVAWNVIGGNGRKSPIYADGGIYKHRSGGYYHHNDFDLNRGCNAHTEHSYWGVWDNGSEGNFWDDWEYNPGYPDVYIIGGTVEDQIDRFPSATRYFNHPIVCITQISYEAEPGEPIFFNADINVHSSSVTWLWEFGDGTTSNETNPYRSYSKSGIYHINVTVTNNQGVSDTDTSTAYIGICPDKPIITGPTNGRRYIDYEYSIVANDLDSDYITYYIDWGDWDNEYIGPVPSGEVITVLHYWEYINNYTVMVKAIDETLRESEWAYLTVNIPRDKAIHNTLIYRILEQFPILKEVISRLIKPVR